MAVEDAAKAAAGEPERKAAEVAAPEYKVAAARECRAAERRACRVEEFKARRGLVLAAPAGELAFKVAVVLPFVHRRETPGCVRLRRAAALARGPIAERSGPMAARMFAAVLMREAVLMPGCRALMLA